MTERIRRTMQIPILVLSVALAFGLPANATDDTAIFSTAVPPNVLLFIDNSGSMNEIMWHPELDTSDSTCPIFGWLAPGISTSTNSPYPTSGVSTLNSMQWQCSSSSQNCRFHITEATTGFVQTGTLACGASTRCGRGGTSTTSCKSGYVSRTFCGRTRKMYVDADTACKDNQTWWSEEYVEWYFSPDADPYFGSLAEPNTSTNTSLIDADQNGTHFITNTPFALYKRARITAAKEIARDVIYQVNTTCPLGGGTSCASNTAYQKNAVRFGTGQFDASANGGYVNAAIDQYITNRATMDAAIGALDAQTSTPLSESLFKVYTYFMSRTAGQLPLGKNGSTAFPKYSYSLTGGAYTASPPSDPLDCDATTAGNQACSCQKNFVIMITDGEPTNDDFACSSSCSSSSTTIGFNQFTSSLIGDYSPQPAGGDEMEVGYSGAGAGSRYLDDIALFMHTNDFRPDISGTQTMDVYTVGFATNAGANDLLQRTAANGNGLFFYGTQSQELTDALVTSINDIIQKSQSFTAATVPASRTADGGNFYITEFVPSNIDPIWEGHLMNFEITVDGRILDANGNCAIDDPSGACVSGVVETTAVPFWDAANQVPGASARTLFTSVNDASRAFTSAAISAADLGVSYPPASSYTGSLAATAGGATNATKGEYLTDEIVEYTRGCSFGSGVSTACSARTTMLGDIFHSNPIVIGQPPAYVNEPSYSAFSTAHATRDRMIYAGGNDGFLHAFHAGAWQAAATPAAYDRGTGTELFGFMPWSARQNIDQLPLDTSGRDYYFVDGSPKAADVWFPSSPTATTKASDGSEWHTLLVGGMRQGGRNYFALEVSDPASTWSSKYLWEYPRETDPTSVKQYLGETWSEPVITKLKVAVGSDDNGGQGYERWVVIVGGGYDVTGDPNLSSSYDATNTSSTARYGRSLFILDAETGTVLAEKKYDYSAGTSTPENQMRYAIASTPAVYDTDFDGYADVIYVGDLGGQLWKWVIHDVGMDSTGDGKLDNWTLKRFFTASKYPNSTTPTRYKSFFFPPAATFSNRTLWLALGSGERADLNYAGIAAPTDASELDNNRFYAMSDLDPLEVQSPALATLTESDLTDVTSDESCVTLTTRGYYFKGDDGEKFVTNAALFAYYVFVSSFTPVVSTDPCVSSGNATLYAFKIDCGEGFFTDAGGAADRALSLGTGMPTDPRISISAGDAGSGGTPPPCGGGTHANKVFVITSDNRIQNECGADMPGGGVGIHYWREQ